MTAKDIQKQLESRAVGHHSRNQTVVEYAAQTMVKGKSPRASARSTAKKLSGSTNMFIDSSGAVIEIDERELEAALWDRLADLVIRAYPKYAVGKEDWAIDGVLQHFEQNQKMKNELRAVVVRKLGRDPFPPQGSVP